MERDGRRIREAQERERRRKRTMLCIIDSVFFVMLLWIVIRWILFGPFPIPDLPLI